MAAQPITTGAIWTGPPIPIAIIGGTGLSSLPSPPFTPLIVLTATPTPWGLPSSPITVLSYTPPASSDEKSQPITIAFLARHGVHHQYAPHEVPFRANVAALRKLGVRCVVGFSAVGSLKEEVKPRDFIVVDQLVDWTRGVSFLCSSCGGGCLVFPDKARMKACWYLSRTSKPG